jgi:hypothetical protein
MTHSDTTPRLLADDHRCPVQKVAFAFGLIFLLVGIAGFIPGITQHVGDMKFAGHESDSELLGVFQVSILHNLVHLAFGIAGLAAARTARAASNYLIVGGVIYLLLAILGLPLDREDSANFIPINDADDWLHLGLGLAMLILGVSLRRHDDDYHEPSAAELNERVRGFNR